MTASFEYRLAHDEDLLSGRQLARVEYRREGVRRWSRFLVVLDDETTYETVASNVEEIIAEREGLGV